MISNRTAKVRTLFSEFPARTDGAPAGLSQPRSAPVRELARFVPGLGWRRPAAADRTRASSKQA